MSFVRLNLQKGCASCPAGKNKMTNGRLTPDTATDVFTLSRPPKAPEGIGHPPVKVRGPIPVWDNHISTPTALFLRVQFRIKGFSHLYLSTSPISCQATYFSNVFINITLAKFTRSFWDAQVTWWFGLVGFQSRLQWETHGSRSTSTNPGTLIKIQRIRIR